MVNEKEDGSQIYRISHGIGTRKASRQLCYNESKRRDSSKNTRSSRKELIIKPRVAKSKESQTTIKKGNISNTDLLCRNHKRTTDHKCRSRRYKRNANKYSALTSRNLRKHTIRETVKRRFESSTDFLNIDDDEYDLGGFKYHNKFSHVIKWLRDLPNKRNMETQTLNSNESDIYLLS
ncbi:hypothetical protein GJ496_008349 [Pomphorhynchus laevis]|nr:hypothetical protein GJ496_008349 [Pomphorhynchus laevis]